MMPSDALRRQIERFRTMTGEQRLQIAMDLHTLSCDVAREGIRHQFPQADEAEVERRLRKRLEAARRRQLFDAAGVYAVQGDTLDVAYLRNGALNLGVDQTLDDLVAGKLKPKST